MIPADGPGDWISELRDPTADFFVLNEILLPLQKGAALFLQWAKLYVIEFVDF